VIGAARQAKEALAAAGPLLLFGLRLWASVCLALYVAFWLQLDNAFWAGTTAALVCEPHLGASLSKAWFLMIGTLVGAVAIVVLTACVPQDRAAFLITLAVWGAACALVSTVLRNLAGYGAALAGYTAAIIAGDLLGATGGVHGDEAFLLAVTRASEIGIGIVFPAEPARLDAPDLGTVSRDDEVVPVRPSSGRASDRAGSQQTPPWREMDSNPRSPGGTAFFRDRPGTRRRQTGPVARTGF
jgi:hypothetical protein